MRVLIASKALISRAYQAKVSELATQPEIEHLTVVVPPGWREPGGRLVRLEGRPPPGVDFRVEPVVLNGNFHLFFWPRLGRILRETRPDVVHMDEEPYNLATVLGVAAARIVGARSLFFTWQNLYRRYPVPFSAFERYVYANTAHAIVGNAEAATVLRRKGFARPCSVVPQFGIDPNLFSPRASGEPRPGTFTIGYVARLVEEKGIWVLLQALTGLKGAWTLRVVGSGPLRQLAEARASELGLGGRVTWETQVDSMSMPSRLRTFSVLVLPSLTRPHWKEQFGRILVEAMACEVPVIGSECGEIPNVIGDAGLLVPEGDPDALAQALKRLMDDPELRDDLRTRGRRRAVQRFTHHRIAELTAEVYRAVAADRVG